jgi:glycosyltransferase involved in cell wall biosynthesis
VRIAIVGPSYPYKGGIAAHTTELAHRLAAAGHDVVVESWAEQYPARLYPGGSQTTDGPDGVPFDPVRSTLSWRRPDSWWQVGRRLRDRDLVVLTMVTPLQAPPYLALLRALRRPHGTRPRTVALCHNVVPHERHAVDERLTRSVLRRAGAVLVHTEPEAVQARRLTDRPVRVATMAPHALAGAGGAAPPGGQPGSVRRRLLFFGTVRPYKGLDVLLRALAAGPAGVSLLVAGDFWGDTREATERLVAVLGLAGRVTLRPGYVPSGAVPALFAEVDALVLPYRTATASQNAWVAFEHGVPVISTRAGTLAEQVTDGVDGILAEPDDVADLAAALRRFYIPGTPEKLRAAVKPLDAEPVWERYLAILLADPGPDSSPR